ncbi:MAG: glycine zipper 2TM domain-containing protein [Steroidobacteraceae bacterium]
MNKSLVVGGIVGALAVTAVAAVAGYRTMDTKTASTPRQECHDVVVTLTRPTKDPDQIAGTVTGAVIGGVLGNQVGSGDGKKLATAGGAIAGGIAGHEIQEGMQERNTYQETQQVCKTVQ